MSEDKVITENAPPKCHFMFMKHEQSDYEEWWQCSYCGHTELICEFVGEH